MEEHFRHLHEQLGLESMYLSPPSSLHITLSFQSETLLHWKASLEENSPSHLRNSSIFQPGSHFCLTECEKTASVMQHSKMYNVKGISTQKKV